MVEPAESLQLQVDRKADLPVGAQLARTLRHLVGGGRLRPGDRLPSVRELAAEAGVNVNTARAVYGRLEHEGLVRSEHGRGTFVAGPEPKAAPLSEAAARRELRRQIAELEAELVSRGRRPPDPATTRASGGGRLTTAAELSAIRDELVSRLQELDLERAELLRRLAALTSGDEESSALAEEAEPRQSSLSLRGARVRWVGV
ncbi:MAG: GntR family transcriptional regulator [Thermoleophilaceae bacterium]